MMAKTHTESPDEPLRGVSLSLESDGSATISSSGLAGSSGGFFSGRADTDVILSFSDDSVSASE